MSTISSGRPASAGLVRLGALTLAIVLAWVSSGAAQMSPEEHASHHPGQEQEKAKDEGGQESKKAMGGMGDKGGQESKKAMGGGMGDMGKMMEGMGAPPPKEIYPSLIVMPDLPPEKRDEVARQAGDRMATGIARLSEAVDRLSQATLDNDHAAMQAATAQMREGLAQFESGLAARRALAEGRTPRGVALHWFKREMDLLIPADAEDSQKASGPSWFHLFSMALLIGFAAVMIWMYFHKMQRATVLLQSLTGGAPPAADAKAAPPAAPPTGKGSAASLPAAGPPGKWSGKLRLGQIFEETPDVKTFRLMDPLGGEIPFSFQPGQYLTVTVLPEGKPVRRSYTIASSPTEHAYVDLTIKREDKGVESRYLHDRVQAGDLLDFAGPSGSFVFTGRECKCLVFIAAGVGITPLMSVTRYLTDRSWPGEIFLLYGCHSPRDFIFKEELEFRQRRHPNLHVVATVSSAEGTAWKGPTGRITKELIIQSVPDITSRRVHICGPKEMTGATEKLLAELGVPKEQVKTEAFGPANGQPEPASESTNGAAAAQANEAKPDAAAGAAAAPAPAPAAPAPVAAAAPEVTAAPAAAMPAPADPEAVATTVTFSRSGKTAPLPPEKSVLEASEDIGVNIPFECRVGTCGVCKTKLLSGRVTMAVEDALTPEDKAGGIILACQAKSTGNVAVEA